MEDDVEDEIFCELFSAHLGMFARSARDVRTRVFDTFIPGPGENMRSKLLQPAPFLMLIFIVIILTIVLQRSSSWLQRWVSSFHRVVNIAVTEPGCFVGFVGTSFVLEEELPVELREGIVGVYGMQGRRGAMEDRFSVVQNVDVGGNKKISLFGVYDGHGGQFTAEYVKEHLFQSTIEKIRLLQQQPSATATKEDKKCVKDESKPSHLANGVIRTGSQKANNTNIDECKLVRKPSEKDERKAVDGDGPMKEERGNGNQISVPEILVTEVSNLTTAAGDAIEISRDTPDPDAQSSCITPSSPSEDKGNQSPKRTSSPHKNAPKIPLASENVDNSFIRIDTYDQKVSSGGKKHGSFSREGDTKKEKKVKEESLDSLYIDANRNINYTRLLTDQMNHIDSQVIERCKHRTDMSGTTAVVAILDGELLIIGNVGDSRAVMGDTRGSTIPLSFDHKPNQLKERRRIKEAGGFISFTGVWRVAGILATSRALGDFPLKEPRKLVSAEPDVLTFSLRDHKAHFVILATDGLWDVLSNEEAVAFVRTHIDTDADFGARALSLHAYHRGSQDNITVAILNVLRLGLH